MDSVNIQSLKTCYCHMPIYVLLMLLLLLFHANGLQKHM